MIQLFNGEWRTHNDYETGALALYCIAKAQEGVAESIIREIFPSHFADQILERDNWRKCVMGHLLHQGSIETRHVFTSITDAKVKTIICNWMMNDEDLIIPEEDAILIAQATGFLCVENVLSAVSTFRGVVDTYGD